MASREIPIKDTQPAGWQRMAPVLLEIAYCWGEGGKEFSNDRNFSGLSGVDVDADKEPSHRSFGPISMSPPQKTALSEKN